MSPRARTVLPTDLVALVSYDGKVFANEAMTRDRMGTHASPHPLETAIEQWFSFATGRHTCVSVKGATLRGLVSARKRATKQAWEIDCLINAEDDQGILMSLLDQITDAAGRSGAMRVFLRVPAGSETEQEAPRAGFVPFVREVMYLREAPIEGRIAEGIRQRSKEDPYPVFQLYNRIVPVEVRQVEGMTFEEWTAAQESLGRTRQYVLEESDGLLGWLRVAGDGEVGRFDVLAETRGIEALVDAGMAKVANRQRAVMLVPEHQVELGSHLQSRGFVAGAEYTVLARRTVRPIKSPARVKAVVQSTFG